MTKIELTDSIEDVVIKMSDGNPGAATVCIQLLTEGAATDPYNWLGGLGVIMSLDTLGLYGPKIWMLFKDVCGEDIVKTIAMLRAWQLGFVSKEKLLHAINSYGDGVDVDGLLEQVKERLPEFGGVG